jgi:outer membrane immunogenic protein
MKRIFVAALLGVAVGGEAFAADLPQPPPRAPAAYIPPPPVYNWTGFYIGGNAGGAWAHGTVTDTLNGLNFSGTTNGVFIGGGQVGANYQINWAVVGVEGTFDWAANNNNTSNGVLVPALGQTVQVTVNNRWLTTVAARFGVAFDRVLVYGKGGGGWVGSSNSTITNVTTGASFTNSGSSTNSGWLAGAGVEWAFWGNWSAKVEYDYLGLSNSSFTVPNTSPVLPGDTFNTSSKNIQMVVGGINYKFGPWW